MVIDYLLFLQQPL